MTNALVKKKTCLVQGTNEIGLRLRETRRVWLHNLQGQTIIVGIETSMEIFKTLGKFITNSG